MSKYNNSSYWMNDWDDDDIIVDQLSDNEKKSLDLYKLASSKRAISNFVNIVTNESIPVKFKERGDSYTDGKSVVIGSRITEPKDFDVAVGLALHEGSHIKLSDFKLLQDIYNLVPTHIREGAIKKGINKTTANNYISELFLSLSQDAVNKKSQGFKKLVADSQTPKGLNMQVLNELKRGKFYTKLIKAMDNINKRVSS